METSETPKLARCRICGSIKDRHDFRPPIRSAKSDKLYWYCKACQKKQNWKAKLKRYGLSVEEYNKLVKKQKGQCAICGTFRHKLYIDHEHKSGKFRGLLCNKCNQLLGMANDDGKILELAISYLYKFRARQ